MSGNVPNYTHSIVHLNAGEVIPEPLLRLLCEQYKSCVGLVVREPNKLEIEKFLELGAGDEQFTLLNKINLNTKKFTRQFTFHACPTEFDEDECQPWIPIRDSKGNPLLTVSLEGDFIGRAGKEGESEAFILMMEYLGPKLEDVFKLSGNNPQRLFEHIATDSFANDLKNTYGHRACFAFMPTMGEPLMLGNFREAGKGGGAYAFGSVSFNLGYEEPAATAVQKEPTMPKNSPAASKYSNEPVDPATVPAQPSVPQVAPVPSKDPIEKVADQITGDEAVKWSPPAHLKGKGLKAAYRAMLNGELPENWQQRPSFMIKAKDTTSSLKEIPKPDTVRDMKEAAPKPVLPVIDGRQQQKAVDFIKKHLGDGSVVLTENPLEAQKQEATLAVFSELCLKTGDIAELDRWPTSSIFAFAKDNPEVAALALIEYRRRDINRRVTLADGDKKLGELAGTGTSAPVTPALPDSSAPTAPPPVPETPPAPRRSVASKYG